MLRAEQSQELSLGLPNLAPLWNWKPAWKEWYTSANWHGDVSVLVAAVAAELAAVRAGG
jgi:hypothetical protein